MPTSAPIDRLLSPEYVEGVDGLAMDELRTRRAECQEIETGFSYVRRLVQGRLDIVQAEIQARSEGRSADLGELIESLPNILTPHLQGGTGFGRPPSQMAPGAMDPALTSGLDAILGAAELGALPDLSPEELRGLFDRLSDYERQVSATRRALHERIDVFQDEIVRRYKTGEATVDALLH